MPPLNRTRPSQIKALEMRAEAVKLRKMGLGYPQIADRVGYNSRQAAHRAVTTALAEIREHTAESADDLRTLEAERLDQLWRIAFTEALTNRNLRAVDTAIRVQDRRAKLFGLDRSDERIASALEQQADAASISAQTIYTVMASILARLNLTPQQEADAPSIVVEELKALNQARPEEDTTDTGPAQETPQP